MVKNQLLMYVNIICLPFFVIWHPKFLVVSGVILPKFTHVVEKSHLIAGLIEL